MVFRRGRTGIFGRRSGLLRRLGWLSIASAVWSNRRDLQRWAEFARRAVQERDRRPMADLIAEAKVRAAVSRDPLLRRDAALEDLRVDDGVVTMLTNTASWPDPRDQMVKLKQVKGITDVTAKPAPADSQRSTGIRPFRSPFARTSNSSGSSNSASSGSSNSSGSSTARMPSSVTFVEDAPMGDPHASSTISSTSGGR